jgi:hypothetical protein
MPAPVAPPPLPEARASVARPDGKAVGEDQVQLRAYLKWEAAGKPAGDGTIFWLEAERELLPAKVGLQKRASM